MLVAQDQCSLEPLGEGSGSLGNSPSSAFEIGFEPESFLPEQNPFRVRRGSLGETLGPPLQAKFASAKGLFEGE